MWIQSLKLENVRSFSQSKLEFSQGVNILVGENNAGKSSILKALHLLQAGSNPFQLDDIRIGSGEGRIEIVPKDIGQKYSEVIRQAGPEFIEAKVGVNKLFSVNKGNRASLNGLISIVEPHNFIYPYFSNRKVTSYEETVNLQNTNQVVGNFRNLYSKIDRISDANNVDVYNKYVRACDEILKLRVSCVPSANGKKAAYLINTHQNIHIDSMGEGVVNVLGLLVDLLVSENNLFLIEELENDIHPRALKALLDLIIDMSVNNQFIITTHSNIVLKKLGAVDGAKVFNLKMDLVDKIPTTTVEEANGPFERRAILEELGYEFYDYDLWSGWLMFEESSAERIVREFLIPWFCPSLNGKLRTFSARTTAEVKMKFDDFNRLYVFMHLEPTYKNKAWVLLDSGDREKNIVEKLKSQYAASGWNESQFLQLRNHDFESYYPMNFDRKISEVLEIKDKKEKRAKKKELLDEVIEWCRANESEAKSQLQNSAAEVIEILKVIESEL